LKRGSGRSICVYCSASERVAEHYFVAARQLGEAMAGRGHRLVYGGGGLGLMGALARAVRAGGSHVLGVIPEALRPRERDDGLADQLIVTQTMRERKQIMEDEAEAFIALPGGYGTFEELLEIITLKQLRYQDKPLVILNVAGYYDGLLAFFEQAQAQHFIHGDERTLFFVTSEVQAALDFIKATLDEQAAHLEEQVPPELAGRPGPEGPSEDEVREAMEGP
jgi:uncharacterized protein (TIGR00730 family)